MLENATVDGKPFFIFCFKYTEYVMNIVPSWMTLYDMERANTGPNYKDRDGQSLGKLFTHMHPFGLHFRCHHQVENHNNKHHFHTWFN